MTKLHIHIKQHIIISRRIFQVHSDKNKNEEMSHNFLSMLPELRMFYALNIWRTEALLEPMEQVGLREYMRKGPVLRNKFRYRK